MSGRLCEGGGAENARYANREMGPHVSYRPIVGTSKGDVIGYGVADGARAWSRTVISPVRAISGSADALYVGTSDGNLYALDRPAGYGAK